MNKIIKLLTIIIAPLTLCLLILWQMFFVQSVNHYAVSTAVIILSLLPFFLSFEKKDHTTREITLIATLIALAVVSRAVFYLIPSIKPFAAVVIISAVCLGAEKGYIIGAFTAFISNFIFGQGFWTPYQMLALGLVGLLAGLLFKKIKANKYTMASVGFVLIFVVYALIVDLSSVLMMSGEHITLSGTIAIYTAGIPFNLVFAVATAICLFFFGEPFVKKIDRINAKFALA